MARRVLGRFRTRTPFARLPAVARLFSIEPSCPGLRSIGKKCVLGLFQRHFMRVLKWYPHPELNGNQRFRKPLLYPFELWGQRRQENRSRARQPQMV